MLEYQCGETAGQFPKFADEVYKIENPTDDRMHFMLPTAEAALASIYRDEILAEADLPKKFFAYTPCFRREAGSARAEERGMVRGHQFNKIEMFQYTRPEDSDDAFDELVTKAERLVKGLGFHFRTVKLAAGIARPPWRGRMTLKFRSPPCRGTRRSPRSPTPGTTRPAGEHPLPPRGHGQDGIRPHPQRLRSGHVPHLPRHGRAESVKGR